MENGLVLLLMLTFQETFEMKIWEGGRNMKPTEEKTYLRIVVKSKMKNMNKHLYIFEQWEGGIFENSVIFNRGIFKGEKYTAYNKYEAKIIMGLLGLNKIRRYRLYYHFDRSLSDCFIEFED